MESTVLFRDFEERDIEFIYKWKNDEKLNSMIVGPFHPITYEDAQKWVRGCMEHHDEYVFWAICTNDSERRIVGWASISKIDKINQSALGHGIVIADPEYRDGIAFFETYLHIYKYVFEVLKLHRFYGFSLIGHKNSNLMAKLMLMKTEGVLRQAVYKNGRFYDLQYDGLLSEEYFLYKKSGEFEIKAVLKRLKQMRR